MRVCLCVLPDGADSLDKATETVTFDVSDERWATVGTQELLDSSLQPAIEYLRRAFAEPGA